MDANGLSAFSAFPPCRWLPAGGSNGFRARAMGISWGRLKDYGLRLSVIVLGPSLHAWGADAIRPAHRFHPCRPRFRHHGRRVPAAMLTEEILSRMARRIPPSHHLGAGWYSP
jgi:hypothetical protein